MTMMTTRCWAGQRLSTGGVIAGLLLGSLSGGLCVAQQNGPVLQRRSMSQTLQSSRSAQSSSRQQASSGSSTSSSTSGTSRNITVSENGKTVEISEDGNTGITVTTTETVDGVTKQVVVKARTAEELEKQNPEAFRLYKQYAGNASATATARAAGVASDAKTGIRNQIRRMIDEHQGNPQMQQLLENMLRDLDKQMPQAPQP